jgi:plastocyanin domain-containing protein
MSVSSQPRSAVPVLDRVEGAQRAVVTVRGGYHPEVVRGAEGAPVELIFDRQESGECTSRVVFPELGVTATLPAHERTTVRLYPDRAGSYEFACGMNKTHHEAWPSCWSPPRSPANPRRNLARPRQS